MLSIKPGVRIAGMQTEILLAIIAARELFLAQGHALTITSVTDGVHKNGSLHYTGRAVDLRLPPVDKEAINLIVSQLQSWLGPEYYVLLEVDHIHVQYSPKVP